MSILRLSFIGKSIIGILKLTLRYPLTTKNRDQIMLKLFSVKNCIVKIDKYFHLIWP